MFVRSTKLMPRSAMVRTFAHRVEMVLKEDVAKLGYRGDVVSVKAGYARNFLYPEKKAVYATKLNLKAYQSEKKEDDGVDNEKERVREQIMKRLSSVEVKFKRHCETPKPNTKFPVSAENIAEKLEKQHGIKVGIARIVLAEPIKTTGNHNVKVRVDDFVDEEFEAARAKVKASGTPAAASDAPVNVSTQTILQQFATDRYNVSQSKADTTESTAEVEDPSAASKRRFVTLKLVVERR